LKWIKFFDIDLLIVDTDQMNGLYEPEDGRSRQKMVNLYAAIWVIGKGLRVQLIQRVLDTDRTTVEYEARLIETRECLIQTTECLFQTGPWLTQNHG
jgi:hypothetical protein